MSGDMMPKQQYDFIKGIQDNMLEASNMTEDDAWRFGFLIWQHQEWICKYLIDRKTEPTISKMEQVDEDINVRSKDEPHIVGKHADAIIIDDSRLTAKCLNCANGGSYKCSKCDGEMYYKYDKDEPQTDCAWK